MTRLPFSLIRPILAILAGLIAVSFTACGGGARVDEPGVLRVGIGGEPRDLDPHTVSGTPAMRVIQSLMEGLVTFHPTDDDIPYAGVAHSWSQTEDGLTWRFFLREEAKWSNGEPLLAEHFVYAWKRVLHPDLGNEYADWLYMIRNAEAYHRGELTSFSDVGVIAEDAHTLRIELHEPVADFLKILLNHTFLPVYPPVIEAHGGPGLRASGWTRPEHHVGNGPFRLVRWEPNSIIRVEPNPHYWDAGVVRLQAIEFFPIEDENTEMRAFESGQLHITNSVPVNMREHYRTTSPENIRFDPFSGVYFLRVNVESGVLRDPQVRRALSLAVNRQQIVDRLLKGGERVATAFTPGGLGGYEPPVGSSFDPDAARKALAEAGYPGGAGFPEIELLFNTSDNHRKIAEAVQAMWREILGIDIVLTNKEWKVYLDTVKARNYDIARAGWVGSAYPQGFLRIQLSYSPNNDSGYVDATFDTLLEEAMRTLDDERRHALLFEAEARMLEATPVIPIYWYTNVFLIDERVRNWAPKLVNQRPYKFVYLDQ